MTFMISFFLSDFLMPLSLPSTYLHLFRSTPKPRRDKQLELQYQLSRLMYMNLERSMHQKPDLLFTPSNCAPAQSPFKSMKLKFSSTSQHECIQPRNLLPHGDVPFTFKGQWRKRGLASSSTQRQRLILSSPISVKAPADTLLKRLLSRLMYIEEA